MSRTTRFQILVVLGLPTFDSNFATLLSCKYDISIFLYYNHILCYEYMNQSDLAYIAYIIEVGSKLRAYKNTATVAKHKEYFYKNIKCC